ncbi:MAG: DUF4097 family beta strand repeat-containing protein [Candidatus Cybelea sp.]
MVLPAGARSIGAVLCTFVVLGACSGASEERVHEQFQKTVATGASPMVSLENVAGDVRVEGWSKPIVNVSATKYGYDEQELRDIAIDVRPAAGSLSIVTSYSAGGAHHGGVRYLIAVPAGASVRINNVVGTVALAGVRGDVTIQTQTGAIKANAGMVSGNRAIDINATTGAITLTIAPGSSATVDASSTVGNFTSDVPGVSQARDNVVGARGAGTIGSGSARIHLTTTTGAIALRQGQ